MKITANEFIRSPRNAFKAASNGVVTIMHDRYDDVVFVLSSRERRPLGEEEAGNAINKIDPYCLEGNHGAG